MCLGLFLYSIGTKIFLFKASGKEPVWSSRDDYLPSSSNGAVMDSRIPKTGGKEDSSEAE